MSIPTGHLPVGNLYTYFFEMDKYERRRLNLIRLRDEQCGGVNAELARRICREASYVNRMFYPEGKKGKKRIGDEIKELIEDEFKLQVGWLDGVQSKDLFGIDEAKLTLKQKEIMKKISLMNDEELTMAEDVFKIVGKKEKSENEQNG